MRAAPPRPRPHAAGAGAGSHPVGPAGRHPAQRRPAERPGRSLCDLARDVAQLYLEVECGRRSARQAAPLLEARLRTQLEGVWVRPGQPGRVLRVAGARSAADVYDAVAVVERGTHVGALAIRLVRRGGRWRVAEAYRPEDGPLPEPDLPPDDEDLPEPLGADLALLPVPDRAAAPGVDRWAGDAA